MSAVEHLARTEAASRAFKMAFFCLFGWAVPMAVWGMNPGWGIVAWLLYIGLIGATIQMFRVAFGSDRPQKG